MVFAWLKNYGERLFQARLEAWREDSNIAVRFHEMDDVLFHRIACWPCWFL